MGMEIMSIDVSNVTLDVIEAVKNKQTIKFDYQYKYSGVNEEPKTYTVKPLGFFGDFDGFEGTDEDTEDRQFKRFRFDNVTDWLGITKPVKVLVELEFNDYPTEEEVEEKLEKQLANGGLLWRVDDDRV
tara:strand:+ start:36 stop:422 length:387 start_codon:yes stop_codon:yes gene_type:complete